MKSSSKIIFSILISFFVLCSTTVPALAATTTVKNSLPQSTISINNVNSTAATSGYTVHGSWWGPTTYYNNVSDGKFGTFIAFVASRCTVPGAVATTVAYGVFGATMLSSGKAYYGFSYKYYEEMYLNGEFAYFRTTFYTYVYSDSSYQHSIGSASAVMTSMAPMIIAE